jgi:ferredoxin
MPKVKFIKENKEIEVPKGANLRQEAKKAGVNLYAEGTGVVATLKDTLANCHGFGMCGECRVKIVKGMQNVSPMGMIENARFKCPVPSPIPSMAYIGNEDTMRLACQVVITGDIEVETRPELNLFGDNFFS